MLMSIMSFFGIYAIIRKFSTSFSELMFAEDETKTSEDEEPLIVNN